MRGTGGEDKGGFPVDPSATHPALPVVQPNMSVKYFSDSPGPR